VRASDSDRFLGGFSVHLENPESGEKISKHGFLGFVSGADQDLDPRGDRKDESRPRCRSALLL
jgi:hypothetical protein